MLIMASPAASQNQPPTTVSRDVFDDIYAAALRTGGVYPPGAAQIANLAAMTARPASEAVAAFDASYQAAWSMGLSRELSARIAALGVLGSRPAAELPAIFTDVFQSAWACQGVSREDAGFVAAQALAGSRSAADAVGVFDAVYAAAWTTSGVEVDDCIPLATAALAGSSPTGAEAAARFTDTFTYLARTVGLEYPDAVALTIRRLSGPRGLIDLP